MTNDSPECVIALAFGYRRAHGKIVPGPPNEQIAEIVQRDFAHLPKILQFEVADAFAKLDPEPVFRIEQHRSGSYLDTREVLFQAAALCKKSGWTTVAVVAHPMHLRRVTQCIEKRGLRIDTEQIARMSLETIDFDKSSEQSWTRSAPSMLVHETLTTALYKAMRCI